MQGFEGVTLPDFIQDIIQSFLFFPSILFFLIILDFYLTFFCWIYFSRTQYLYTGLKRFIKFQTLDLFLKVLFSKIEVINFLFSWYFLIFPSIFFLLALHLLLLWEFLDFLGFFVFFLLFCQVNIVSLYDTVIAKVIFWFLWPLFWLTPVSFGFWFGYVFLFLSGYFLFYFFLLYFVFRLWLFLFWRFFLFRFFLNYFFILRNWLAWTDSDITVDRLYRLLKTYLHAFILCVRIIFIFILSLTFLDFWCFVFLLIFLWLFCRLLKSEVNTLEF